MAGNRCGATDLTDKVMVLNHANFAEVTAAAWHMTM